MKLIELNLDLIAYFTSVLSIKTEMILSSSLGADGYKTDRLVNLCNKVSGTTYLSGKGALDYLERDKFTQNNITLQINELPLRAGYQNSEKKIYSLIDYCMEYGTSKLNEFFTMMVEN